MRIAIEGGRVMLPDGTIGEMTVTLAEQRIVGVGHAIAATHRWRARGLLVLPGIVDLHGDAFEKDLMPRSGVMAPYELALPAVDRQLLACGVTTAFHGVTVSWEPGLRGIETAAALLDAIERLRPDLDCDTRIHLRFEILTIDAVDIILGWIAADRVDLLAFNDHAGVTLRALAAGRGATLFRRSGLDRDAYRAGLEQALAGRDAVPAALARLAHAAAARGLPLASHDDETPAMRERYRALGCTLCEFPVDTATAEAAVRAGDAVVLGAPNVVRGASHARRLSARQAVGDRLCTVLTSDYHYPSLTAAPFRLAAERIVDLATAWRLVSTNPAAAAGLTDRGTIAVGQRADLVLIDDRRPGLPRVAATVAGGRIVHVADAALATAIEHFPGSEP